jgi:hypothetical protein
MPPEVFISQTKNFPCSVRSRKRVFDGGIEGMGFLRSPIPADITITSGTL